MAVYEPDGKRGVIALRICVCKRIFLRGIFPIVLCIRIFTRYPRPFPKKKKGSAALGREAFFVKIRLNRALQKQFRDFHGVGRRALADLVARAPKREGVVVYKVVADAPDVDKILIARIKRHGIDFFFNCVR